MEKHDVNRLVIIDGNAILHRAYYAMPQWRDKGGEATSGVYGFFSMLLKVRDEMKPKFLAVAFDHPSPTFRHVMYVGYQHARNKDRQIEEDIWGQVEKLKGWLVKLGVGYYQVEGFEADDIIGTIAFQAVNRKFEIRSIRLRSGRDSKFEIDEVIIVTGDRDLFQLVNDKVKVFMPVKGLSEAVLFDERGVEERMGVKPKLIVDYKGLAGDASDSYPGVPGIGPKTAAELLSHFGSLEGVYKHIKKGKKDKDEILSETVVKKLAEGYDGAEVSKRLAAVRKDVPVSWDRERARMPDDDAFAALFEEMNYPSLKKRITGESEIMIKKSKSESKKTEGQMELV